jgi:hypothetical protein
MQLQMAFAIDDSSVVKSRSFLLYETTILI